MRSNHIKADICCCYYCLFSYRMRESRPIWSCDTRFNNLPNPRLRFVDCDKGFHLNSFPDGSVIVFFHSRNVEIVPIYIISLFSISYQLIIQKNTHTQQTSVIDLSKFTSRNEMNHFKINSYELKIDDCLRNGAQTVLFRTDLFENGITVNRIVDASNNVRPHTNNRRTSDYSF